MGYMERPWYPRIVGWESRCSETRIGSLSAVYKRLPSVCNRLLVRVPMGKIFARRSRSLPRGMAAVAVDRIDFHRSDCADEHWFGMDCRCERRGFDFGQSSIRRFIRAFPSAWR